VATEHETMAFGTVVDAVGAWFRAVAALSGANQGCADTEHSVSEGSTDLAYAGAPAAG
jgi:hypothetical protein